MDRHKGSEQALSEIASKARGRSRLVFVSGNFNIVHPGHLRLLQFAVECGDFLVVGVNAGTPHAVTIPAELRLEGVRAVGIVGYAFLLDEPPETFILKLKPAVVVKGKEFEDRYNPEREAVDSYEGTLLFSSGEVRFSSLDLLQRELLETNFSAIRKPKDFPTRHGFDFGALVGVVRNFSRLRVTVIGDLIVDEYINCDPLGMSQEDPTIVVTPIKHDLFVGGAGIVAAHASGLGARTRYVGVVGVDETAKYAAERLTHYRVGANLIADESRPTPLKQRYRANGKTLLRVSHLRQHDISHELADTLFAQVEGVIDDTDLLIFSDFNYGCLPQALVDRLIESAARRGVMMVADSQTSSQIGDVSRFTGMRLITPTEYEARVAVRDHGSGLVVLAEALRRQASADQLFVTMGAEGLLIHAPANGTGEYITDQLPAFNSAPKDVSGAGDSLLTCSSLALAAGADIWQSAYLGSVAAACQVSRVGNLPLTTDELVMELGL